MYELAAIDAGDWALTVLAGIIAGAMAGIGTIFSWLRASKAEIYVKVDELEKKHSIWHEHAIAEMRDLWKTQNDQDIVIGNIKTSQGFGMNYVEEFRSELRELNRKIDGLYNPRRDHT